MNRLVIVESPYAGDVEANVDYARRACLDVLDKGDVPFASHLLYPQFLNDRDEGERHCGIQCGYEIARRADLVAFYVDNGWSKGMEQAIERLSEYALPFEVRRINRPETDQADDIADTLGPRDR